MDFPTLAAFFSGISFLFFGVTCLTTAYMKSEFVRYGYDRQRPITGVLQILGGLGILVGYYAASPALVAFSATGLSLMMMFGFGVRMKIGDTLFMAAPAFFYAALNLYLGIYYGSSVIGYQ
jgi:hypothetical protein